MGWGQPLDLVPDVVEALELEVATEAHRQLAGDGPVGPRHAGGGDLASQSSDAAFDVGGGAIALGIAGGGQHHVGLAHRRCLEAVDGDHEAGAGQAPAGQIVIGKVGQRVGAQQHEGGYLAVGGGGQDGAGGHPPLLGDHTPLLLEPGPAGIELDAAGEHARGEAHVEGTHDVGPPEGRQEGHARNARQDTRGLGHQVG